MFKIVLSALLVAAVVAEPCCTPTQWEGTAGSIVGTVTAGKSNILEVGSAIAYDFENKMLAFTVEFSIDGMDVNNKTIINYQDKEMYMINSKMGTCVIAPVVGEMMQACTPDGAKERGPFYYGYKNNKLMANAFKFSIPINDQDKDMIMGEVAVTAMDCVPVAEVVYGRVGQTDMMTTIGFVDITAGIKDKTVFDPPTVCVSPKVQRLKTPIKLNRMSFMGLPSVTH